MAIRANLKCNNSAILKQSGLKFGAVEAENDPHHISKPNQKSKIPRGTVIFTLLKSLPVR